MRVSALSALTLAWQTRSVEATPFDHAIPGASIASFQPTKTISVIQPTGQSLLYFRQTGNASIILKRTPQRGTNGIFGVMGGTGYKSWSPSWLKGSGADKSNDKPAWYNLVPNWLTGLIPTVKASGGADLPVQEFCSQLANIAISSIMNMATGGAPRSQTITITLPGADRKEKDVRKECAAAYKPGAWDSTPGGRDTPWGIGSPPVIVVSKGPKSSAGAACEAATKELNSKVSSVFSSISGLRTTTNPFGTTTAARTTVTLKGGVCIPSGKYSNGNIPNVYPTHKSTTGGAAIAAPAPSSIASQPSPSSIATQPSPTSSVSQSTPTSSSRPAGGWEAWAGLLPKASSPKAPAPKSSVTPPKAPASPQGPVESLDVETVGEEALCRQYPDLLTNDWGHVLMLEQSTQIKVNCWTVASLPGQMGVIGGSNIWLHDKVHDCWIHEQLLKDPIKDIPRTLQFCNSPQHLVAGLQPQYSRQDCYEGPTLNAPSKNLGSGNYIDVTCQMFGETVRGNYTWIKTSQDCYMPGNVFENTQWFGPGLARCK